MCQLSLGIPLAIGVGKVIGEDEISHGFPVTREGGIAPAHAGDELEQELV